MKAPNREIWTTSVERPIFGVSESHPIHALHYRWHKKQESRYDMHYGLELGILLEGRMRRHYRDAEFDVRPGRIWLCGVWEPHGYRITRAPCETVVLIIFPPMLARTQLDPTHGIRWLASFEPPPSSRPQLPKRLESTLLEIARNIKNTIRCRRRNKDAWLELKLMEILLLLQDDWNAPTTTGSTYLYSPAKIAKALSLVFENNRFVSTQEAARSCSMNRNAFGRKFKEIMGIPFSEFGLRYRISEAAKQLRNTDLPTKAIAAEWGFTDASHLYRCFLKYYGYSPTEYRRLNIHEKGFPRSLTCKRGFAPVILPSSRRG